jgi:mRNA interferase RelE/StbE
MSYEVRLSEAAKRSLKRLQPDIQARIVKRLVQLQTAPRPPDVKKLRAQDNLYRIRGGDYRIVYTIHDRVLTVIVVKIGHRREVYD